MSLALRLARRGYGMTSPNPMVGAVLVKGGKIIGRGWHHRAGQPHAEIEALHDAKKRGNNAKGATLYVTLEPCSTHGRTPPCTEAIIAAGIKNVIVGATDPNPQHRGKAFKLLEKAGIFVEEGVLANKCEHLNEAFNHWIVHRTPFITVKAAMTLDGKIATANGESKWITSEAARAHAMHLRQGADALLIGVNTVLADDPSLTVRGIQSPRSKIPSRGLRRIVLDPIARTPLSAKVVSDGNAALTTIVVSKAAPKNRTDLLASRVRVLIAPDSRSARPRAPGASSFPRNSIDLPWLLKRLGSEEVTNLLVEGGGETNASFLMQSLAHRIAFFYAPKVLGGRTARKAVAGDGATRIEESLDLRDIEWSKIGPDLFLTARLASPV